MDIDDVKAFVEVADAGGLTAASQRLRVSKSVVSRRLAKLDGVLDALHRQQLGHLEEQQLRTLSDVLAAARAR